MFLVANNTAVFVFNCRGGLCVFSGQKRCSLCSTVKEVCVFLVVSNAAVFVFNCQGVGVCVFSGQQHCSLCSTVME